MISHRYKSVFVHVPKTGGQSIELAFLAAMGKSWSDRAPLLLRRNSDMSFGPVRLAHLFAKEYVENGHMFQDDFDTYFKFAFVRDPLARIRSNFLFKTGGDGVKIRDFVETCLKEPLNSWRYRHVAPQSQYLCDATGKLMTDEIGRFENFETDAARLLTACGVPFDTVPHRNPSRSDKNDEDIGLNAASENWLRNVYAEDYERFGYV